MFPNVAQDEIWKVHSFFAEHITKGSQRLLIPLAAQRLAAWSSKYDPSALVDISFDKDFEEQARVFKVRGIAFAMLPIDAAKQKAVTAINEANDEVIAGFIKDKNFSVSLSSRFESE
jgi:hypothetical protein